jgi:hypothetical protein
MKNLFSPIIILVFAGSLLAGPIDGKWQFETKTAEGKGKGGKTVSTVLDLKAEGSKVTGQVSASAGKRNRSADIVDGKLDGNRVSFTTVEKTKKKEVKLLWSGVLEGDQLKLTRMKEGRKRGTDVLAKRQ